MIKLANLIKAGCVQIKGWPSFIWNLLKSLIVLMKGYKYNRKTIMLLLIRATLVVIIAPVARHFAQEHNHVWLPALMACMIVIVSNTFYESKAQEGRIKGFLATNDFVYSKGLKGDPTSILGLANDSGNKHYYQSNLLEKLATCILLVVYLLATRPWWVTVLVIIFLILLSVASWQFGLYMKPRREENSKLGRAMRELLLKPCYSIEQKEEKDKELYRMYQFNIAVLNVELKFQNGIAIAVAVLAWL